MISAKSGGLLTFFDEKQSYKLVSKESDRLLEDIDSLKKGLTLIQEKVKQVFQFGGNLAVKDFLNCSMTEIEFLRCAIEQDFFFPILGLRKKGVSDNTFVSRSIESLAAEIKSDLLALASKAYDIDPMLVPLFFGLPPEECKKMKNFLPTEFSEYAELSEWVPTVQPYIELVRMKRVDFFKYLSLLICRRSKTDLIPLEMPSISNFHILYNAKNANVKPPKLNFHRIDTLNDAAFLINQGLERSLVAVASNIWTLRLRDEGDEILPRRRSTEDLKFKDISSEAPYRIYLNLYNYLASSKDNEPIDFRRTAVAFQIVSQLFEVSDCWKDKKVVSLTYTLSYTASLYQTFSWVYVKSYLSTYDRSAVNQLTFNKFMRLRPGPYHAWLSEIVHCKNCNNNFVACNVFNMKKVCPICGEKQTI